MTHPRRMIMLICFKIRHDLDLVLTATGLSLTLKERTTLEATDKIIKRLREEEEKKL